MDPVLDDVPTELVGRAVHVARLDAAAREPPGIGAAEMVTALRFTVFNVLAEGGPAEFATEADESVIEQPALLEVLDEGRAGLVGVEALLGELAGEEIAVLIPAGMHQLREAYTALGEAAGDEAVIGEGAGLEDIGSVHLEHRLRLVFKIEQVGYRRLHAKRHFILGDARINFRVADLAEVLAVQCLHVVEHRATRVAADTSRVAHVGNRVADAAEAHALMLAGEEAVGPVVFEEELTAGLGGVGRGHHDIRRQILVHRAEAVGKPGTHRRAAGNLRAGHEEGHTRRVVHRFGVHRTDDADLIGDGT